MKKLALLLAFLLSSCTHWLIDTETRIQVKNETGVEIYDFSIISETEKIRHLVRDVVEPDSSSRIYEHELVGKFNFVVFSEGIPSNLGVHKLKGGMVFVRIIEKDGKFAMEIK